jgi:hypothetical protein
VSLGSPCGPCTPGLITRGFVADTIVTRGLGECPKAPIPRVIVAAKKIIRGSGKKLKKIIISAKLLTVNEEIVEEVIQGQDMAIFYEEDRYSSPKVIAKWLNKVVKNVAHRIVIRARTILGSNRNGNN